MEFNILDLLGILLAAIPIIGLIGGIISEARSDGASWPTIIASLIAIIIVGYAYFTKTIWTLLGLLFILPVVCIISDIRAGRLNWKTTVAFFSVVIVMMLIVFIIDNGYDNGYRKGYADIQEELYKEYYDEGYDTGFAIGNEQGNRDGYQDGLKDGYDEGYDDGRLNKKRQR